MTLEDGRDRMQTEAGKELSTHNGYSELFHALFATCSTHSSPLFFFFLSLAFSCHNWLFILHTYDSRLVL